MKLYFSVLTLLLLTTSAISQTTETSKSVSDTTEKPKTSIVLATIYGSNLSYYGQTSAATQPYVLGYGRVKFPTGIWLSAQTYKLLDSTSGMSGTNFSLGYDFNLSKKISASLSYGRSFYPAGSQVLQSANEDMVSAGLTYDSKWFTTDLMADYSIANGGTYYTRLQLSKTIDLGLSLSAKDYFTLEPSFDIAAGTQQFFVFDVEDEPEAQPSGNNGNNGNNGGNSSGKRKNPVEYIADEIKNGKVGNGQNKKFDGVVGGDENSQSGVAIVNAPFNVLSYNFNIPLAYNRAKYTIEAAYQGSILSKAVSDSRKLQSFFNLSFYYIF